MSNRTASKNTARKPSASASDDTSDEDDLKTLKLQDSDLERFASYFDVVFQGNSRSITVLVALLQRLCELEKLRQQKQSGIWIEDIVGRLTHRLYTRCGPGAEAASRFAAEASELAESIFSEGLAVPNEL
jgi:hypothetical protein